MQRNKALQCDRCGQLLFTLPCKCGCKTASKLREEDYRRILSEQTGKTSCKDMTESELVKIKSMFDQAGWGSYWQIQEKRHQEHRRQTMGIIYSMAHRLFQDNYKARLEGFLKEVVKKPSLGACDDKELRQVIGWLRRFDKQQLKRKVAAYETIETGDKDNDQRN